jgi:hypothetical protein
LLLLMLHTLFTGLLAYGCLLFFFPATPPVAACLTAAAAGYSLQYT